MFLLATLSLIHISKPPVPSVELETGAEAWLAVSVSAQEAGVLSAAGAHTIARYSQPLAILALAALVLTAGVLVAAARNGSIARLLKRLRGETGNPLAGEALRYAIATALSAMLTLALPVIFKHALQLTPAYGVALTLALVMAINFVTVRYFVFRSRAPALRQFTAFAASSVVFRLFEYAAFLLLYGVFGLHYLPALLLVLVVSFAAKFIVQRRFIFLKRP